MQARLGLQLPEVERVVPWVEYLAIARAAEAAGFDSLWVGDHLLYRGDGREERAPWDAWTTLAALAVVTQRPTLGPLVACTAFSPAGLLARRASAVHELSGGRLVLAVGAGWNRTEFDAFGVPFDHRATRFEEAFEILRRLLAGDRVTSEGRFERVHDAVLLPKPTSRPTLMIGSTGERVLRATLPHVDAWNIWCDWYGNTPEGFAAANARLTALAAEAGREPAEITRTATVYVSIGNAAVDRPHAAEVLPVSGTAAAVGRRLIEFAEAGVEEVILVVTPITEASVQDLAEVVAAFAAS